MRETSCLGVLRPEIIQSGGCCNPREEVFDPTKILHYPPKCWLYSEVSNLTFVCKSVLFFLEWCRKPEQLGRASSNLHPQAQYVRETMMMMMKLQAITFAQRGCIPLWSSTFSVDGWKRKKSQRNLESGSLETKSSGCWEESQSFSSKTCYSEVFAEWHYKRMDYESKFIWS